MTSTSPVLSTRIFSATVIVTALGYFVDMYDFFIFNVLRKPSLLDLGLSGDDLTHAGLLISNCQMAGILIGSFLWGILGDRLGRKACLFASILVYSIASLWCSTVHSVDVYAAARFLAGLGVAGELGVGVTLITEKLASDRRGYGVVFFMTAGCLGVITASAIAEFLNWRQAYVVGGVMGLALLFARAFVFESGIYKQMAGRVKDRGKLRLIFRDPKKLRKYIAAIFTITPIVFIPQILWTLSPELAKAQGITGAIKANHVLLVGYCGAFVGELVATALSEKFRSRKLSILVFYIFGVICFLKYEFLPSDSITAFYVLNGLLGFSFGIWMIGVTLAAEHVGTNMRATVTTTVPNLSRAMTIPMNLAFAQLAPSQGPLLAAGLIGLVIFSLALWGWFTIDETYGRDLNFEEN